MSGYTEICTTPDYDGDSVEFVVYAGRTPLRVETQGSGVALVYEDDARSLYEALRARFGEPTPEPDTSDRYVQVDVRRVPVQTTDPSTGESVTVGEYAVPLYAKEYDV